MIENVCYLSNIHHFVAIKYMCLYVVVTLLQSGTPLYLFLSENSSEARDSRDHFFHLFFSPDFHELWPSMMSISLFTKLSSKWVNTEMGDRFCALVVSLMALQLALVDQNPFWPC